MSIRLTRTTGTARPVRRAPALAAAAVLTLGVAACGDDDDSDDDAADDTSVEQPADDDADEADDTDHFDAEGNAEVELDVKATSEDGSLDCTTDSCVVKLFGDHQSGFGDVAELPVSFAS